MTNLEKLKELLNKVKHCPDADIHFYWQDVCALFIPLPRAERNECIPPFYKWTVENRDSATCKFYYGEFIMGAHFSLGEEYEAAFPLLLKARKYFEEQGDQDAI